jgi:hypothetical protein
MNGTVGTIRNFRRLGVTCPRQWLYLIGNEGVVYSESQNRFAGLDAAAVSAYQAFDAGATTHDLAVFSNPHHPSAVENRLEAIHALSQGVFYPEDPGKEWLPLEHSVTANIEIHGIPVLLEHPAGELDGICRDYFRNCPNTTQPARYRLYAQSRHDGWAIYVNDRELLSSLQDEQLGLGLLHAARSLLYSAADYDVAFHASMVAKEDCGLMLSAPRESGKSTLAAYLLGQGFELLADEPALLHLDSCAVSPLAFPLSLKEGSWSVLQHQWTEFSMAPVHIRSDGIKIRLLHPPRASVSAQPRCLTHIVFPQYSALSEPYMERLSVLDTLNLLNEGGVILSRHLKRDTFEAFLRWICASPAYMIRYASLQEASRMIQSLLAEIESSPAGG